MAYSPFYHIRELIDSISAQGLRYVPATILESLVEACEGSQLAQLTALVAHVQQQQQQGRIDQKSAETFVKAQQTLRQAEFLICRPDVVDVSAIQKIYPEQSVFLANDDMKPPAAATLSDLLNVVNPFARSSQVSHYLQRASAGDLRRSVERIWCDYALLPAIRNGLAARPDDAFQLAQDAIVSKNLVTQRTALAVLESLGAETGYRRAAVDLLRERAQKVKEPVKYLFMEAIATLEGSLPVYRMAQQKFFHEHAALVWQLSSKKKSERGKALKALAKTKNPCFTQAILTMLDDPEIAQVAIEVAVKIGAFPAIPRLVSMLNGSFQRIAALALYKFGDRRGIEFLLKQKLQSSAELSVKFTEYGPLMLYPFMRVLRQVTDPAESAKGCWEIFNSMRSQDFARRVLHSAEGDPVLARQLAAVIRYAYPGEYVRLIPPESDNISNDLLRTLIMTVLGRNPHRIVASLKDKSLISDILVTPDSRHAVTLNGHGDVSVWDTETWKKTATFTLSRGRRYSALYAVALSINGNHLLAANSQTHSVDVFEFLRWRSPVASLQQADAVYGVGTTADGKYVLGGGKESVTVWEWGTWRTVATLSGHQHGVEAIKAVPGKPFMVTGDRQGTLQVWEQGTWKNIAVLQVHGVIATSAACSPDGQYLAVVDTPAAYLETNIRVWKTDSWSEVACFAVPGPSPVSCFAFTPDSEYLITGADDIKFLRVGTWEEHLRLSNRSTRALAALPDGEHVIAGSNVWKIDRTQLP